jgi:hypothetical protein
MHRTRWLIVLAAFSTVVASSATRTDANDVRNIILIAGLKSHGPDGNGIHDYAWSVRLLKTALESSIIRERVHVSLHLNGWPTDSRSLEDADTVMIISDGRDGENGREADHLATDERIRLVDTRSLDAMNAQEMLDLLAWLISAGSRDHPIFQR